MGLGVCEGGRGVGGSWGGGMGNNGGGGSPGSDSNLAVAVSTMDLVTGDQPGLLHAP